MTIRLQQGMLPPAAAANCDIVAGAAHSKVVWYFSVHSASTLVVLQNVMVLQQAEEVRQRTQ